MDVLDALEISIQANNGRIDPSFLAANRPFVQKLTKQNLAMGKIKSGSLVEYRGMVQDMFDPELYCREYMDSQSESAKTGLFRDSLPQTWRANEESLAEREVVYLVPVPGETPWMRKKFLGVDESVAASMSLVSDSTVQVIGNNTRIALLNNKKRERTEDNDVAEALQRENVMETESNEDDVGQSKRNKSTTKEGKQTKESKIQLTENFPLLPSTNDVACMAKFYDDSIITYEGLRGDVRLQLSNIVRLVGILSLDYLDEANEEKMELEGGIETRDCLPASVAPRLHVLHVEIESSVPAISSFPSLNLVDTRSTCAKLLSRALHGDSLAGEFALLWLASSLHSQFREAMVGKLALCFSRMNAKSVDDFESLLREIVPRYQRIRMDDLDGQFLPKKNMEMNRLIAGRLQVADGTRLIFDETTLTPRQLSQTALKNLQALKRLVENQTVEYDFVFFNREQQVDQPVLVLSSTNKACLVTEVECTIPVLPESLPNHMSLQNEGEALLDPIRVYLETIKSLGHQVELSEEICRQAESDFVEGRKPKDSTLSESDLHLWLNMTRLIAASFGCVKATGEHYTRARMMDEERKKRILSIC